MNELKATPQLFLIGSIKEAEGFGKTAHKTLWEYLKPFLTDRDQQIIRKVRNQGG